MDAVILPSCRLSCEFTHCYARGLQLASSHDMATLDSLKWALRHKATEVASFPAHPLSESQYRDGFGIVRNSEQTTYQDFIIPQLSLLLGRLLKSPTRRISVLEVGPGPESVLWSLPAAIRRKVRRYVALEPNNLFATILETRLSTPELDSPLPCLESPPDIRRSPFNLDNDIGYGGSGRDSYDDGGPERFDVVLFCHNMYGVNPQHIFIERALELLVEQPEGGTVQVFHRDGALRLGGLICQRTASWPTGVVRVVDDDKVLDCFSAFIAGFVFENMHADKAVRTEWRAVCRALCRREDSHPGHLLFSSPNVMMSFTRQATTMLPELAVQVPLVHGGLEVKNREVRLHRPAAVVRPTDIRHVQRCVRWAQKHEAALTVVGGGHSGHCLWPNVVAIDMGAFDQVHILTAGKDKEDGDASVSDAGPLVVTGAGCKLGNIVRKTMASGLAVPLGARPSVGAGLWLQGGIGHLARLHGLAVDAIVGAVMVSVATSHVICVGRVPSHCRPTDIVRLAPGDEDDLLWAIRGAGTNFGIVVSVTFKAYRAPVLSVRNWVVPVDEALAARGKLRDFDELIAKKLPRTCSADAYLYRDEDKLRLGISMFECPSPTPTWTGAPETPASICIPVRSILGREEDSVKTAVDGVGLFDTEMYMSGMHGGHGGGKTSSFKRCLFLKHIGEAEVASFLLGAVEASPSPLCYIHLLQGGGAINDITEEATAFGCRDWDFACVVTGVWPRDQDGTEVSRDAMQWVYDVVRRLLPLSAGAYAADLGPDPRDAPLAARAFGPNRPRLSRLKGRFDPENVLAYACPISEPPSKGPTLIVLVTGESCAGKDYSADVWASTFIANGLTARVVSISDATKREYAAVRGADLGRLLCDRGYKEQHRPALTAYFQDQVRRRPRLPEEHFVEVVDAATDVEVLFITGMRDEEPVAALSHLVPDKRLLEVCVRAGKESRQSRRGCSRPRAASQGDTDSDPGDGQDGTGPATHVFDNDTTGPQEGRRFCEKYLLPLVHKDLERLSSMVQSVPDFPRQGIEFRHVLDIAQKPGGLDLCASLLQAHFTGDWSSVNTLACCETGGFLYASALGARVNVPLALIRKSGKLPPPTVSVTKSPSHISSFSTTADNGLEEESIEIGRDAVPTGASVVVVVDDVLATGKTLRAVLQLLVKAGVRADCVHVMVVAEFPVHRGRDLLRRAGFGGVKIQSLLVFGGA